MSFKKWFIEAFRYFKNYLRFGQKCPIFGLFNVSFKIRTMCGTKFNFSSVCPFKMKTMCGTPEFVGPEIVTYDTVDSATGLPVCLLVYLSIYISICISIYLSICISIYLYICISIYLSICISIYLSICISIYFSICISIYLSIYIYLTISEWLNLA